MENNKLSHLTIHKHSIWNVTELIESDEKLIKKKGAKWETPLCISSELAVRQVLKY